MKRVEIKQALQMQASEEEITVMGWVRNKRGSKNVAFIALNDGSTINNLQLVIDLNVIPEENLALMHAGASLWAKGVLVASMGSGQAVELSVKDSICCSILGCLRKHRRELIQIHMLTCLPAQANQKKRQEIIKLAKDKKVVKIGLKRNVLKRMLPK